MSKKMNIMVALSIFLVAVLFMGAASAAAVTINNTTSNTVYVGMTVNSTNSTGPGDTYYLLNSAKTAVADNNTKISFEAGAGVVITADMINSYGFFATKPANGDPVSAGILTVSDAYRPVAESEDAFVYEHIIITGATNKLTKYSEGTNPTAVNQIAGVNGEFYLTEAAVNNQYGAYYYAGNPANKDPTFIYVWYPEITLQGELTTGPAGQTSGDSIDGKTINKNTNVTFLINSPKVAPAFGNAIAKIVFTTPAGGKTTEFGGATFDDRTLVGTQTPVGSVTPTNDAVAGTWTAQAEYKTSPFNDYAKKSNTVSFTVQSTTLTLTAAKDSVVRSNPFTVTIQADSQMVYFIYLDGASTSEVNPTLQPAQSGMLDVNVMKVAKNGGTDLFAESTHPNLNKTWGYFETDASGQRTVQYNTADNTEDKTYTVKVYATGMKKAAALAATTADVKGNDYDSVKVKVEKGAVTISASGDGAYFIGDEIKLTGTNTDSDYIYLFLTGQNLKENGIVLKQLPTKVDAKLGYKDFVAVKTDDTWEYKWDTSKIALDTGAYTIYATSRITNGKSSSEEVVTPMPGGDAYTAVKLSDSEYATVSVNLKQPFLSAVPSGTVIAQGDKLYVRGTAQGNPNNLKLYIFGPNFFEDHTITVEDDSSYEKKLDISSTMSSNQYFVVVQHPMYNGVFDAKLVSEDDGDLKYFKIDNATTGGLSGSQGSFVVWGTNKLQGSQAADALTKMIDDANIDDIYTKLTFTVAAPWIRIVNPGDQAAGSKFTIKGTTNLAIDDQILVEVVSSSFTASDKTLTNTNSGVSQTTKVVAGESADNAWSIDVDTTNWKLDQYTIKVNGIEVDVTTTADFNLVEKVVTTAPTTTATTATTTTAPVTTTATPTTPGFGAFIALAGLGAVALLVLRRN